MKEKRKTRKLRATYDEIKRMFPVFAGGEMFFSRDEMAHNPTRNGWWEIVQSPLGPGAPFRRQREALPLSGDVK